MHVMHQPLTPSTTTGSANSTTNHVIAAAAGKRHCLSWIEVAFTGGTPASTLNATVSDGTTTLTIPVPNTGKSVQLSMPVGFASGASVTVSVPAAGVGISSIVSTGHVADPV